MRLLPIAMLVFALSACRTGRIAATPTGLDAHLAAAQAPAGSPPAASTELAEFEARTRAIMAGWDQRLSQPTSLPTILHVTPEGEALRTAAAAPSYAASLAGGIAERAFVVAVFERNPQIRAGLLKLRAAVNQYDQVTALDTILSQYASFQRASRSRVGMPLSGERMDQRFPFPGSLELKAALVRHAVEEARAAHAGVVRDVIVEARILFARYVLVGREIGIAETTLGYLVQLEKTARSKLETGKGSKARVIQVQVEASGLQNRLTTLRQDQAVIRADMARLLDIPTGTAIGPPSASALPTLHDARDALHETALASQPDVAVAEARLRRMQTMIELAEQTAYPPFSAGLGTMEDPSHATTGSDKEREPFDTRPKIKPDPWFGTKEAYLREARESARAAEARVVTARNGTRYAVDRALAELETAHRLYALYRDVQLAQARQAYEDAAAGYAAERGAFLNVVDTLRRWLAFRLEAHRAVRDIHRAHAMLEGAVGRPLREE